MLREMAVSSRFARFKSKNVYIIGLCTLLLLVLSACLPEPQTESPDSGELVIYTSMDEEPFNTYLAEFKSQYPDVQVTAVRNSTGAITAQLLAERDDPQGDVVWGLSATVQNVLEWNDVLTPYAPAGLERVSPSFRDSRHPPHWVGFGTWMSAVCVNTEMLAGLGLPVPESWAALADPIYKDQVTMPSPVTSSTGLLIVEGLLETDGEVKGWEYLDALDENIRLYTESSHDACAMAVAGEIAIGLANDQIAVESAAANASITAVFPSEGSGWDMEANSLIRKEEISPTALLFLDWAISDSAMKAYGKNHAILSIEMDGFQPPPGFPPEPVKQLLDKDFPWSSANRSRVIDEWFVRYQAKMEVDE